MAPYLQTVKSFADVPKTDAGIDTLAFLEASEGVVGIFDLLNSTALGFVSADMKGNITKIRTRHDAAPSKSQTLELLVKNEKEDKQKTATDGLVWLNRGLDFTCKALQAAQEDKTKSLYDAFTASYKATLKPHHSWIVGAGVTAALNACPRRDVLYDALKKDKDSGQVVAQSVLDDELDKWLVGLDGVIDRINSIPK